MKWERLKNMKCPKCNRSIEESTYGYKCTDCDFIISQRRFNELLDKLYKKPDNTYHHNDYRNADFLNSL